MHATLRRFRLPFVFALALHAAVPAPAQVAPIVVISGPGPFDGAAGIATTCCGDRVLVADRNRHVVEVFDRDGVFLYSWGSFGSLPGELDDPDGISVDCAGNVYVADEDNRRIQRFDLDGGGAAVVATGLATPRGVAVTRDGSSLWVAQRSGSTVPSFSPAGVPGSEAAGLTEPFDVTTGCPGRVIVADTFGHRVAVFDLDGTLVDAWPVPEPVGIAADCSCNVFVASLNSVHHYDSGGTLLSTWGGAGTSPGQFLGLFGLAADGLGRLYTVETLNQRVQVFDVGTTAPLSVIAPDVRCLWPPSHAVTCFSPADFEPVVSGGCGSVPEWVLVGCESDQPEDGLGDGAFSPDCWIGAAGSACVRSERQGMEPRGRTYTVLAVPSAGLGCETPQAIGVIHVPRDRREHENCLRAGPDGPEPTVPSSRPQPRRALSARTRPRS